MLLRRLSRAEGPLYVQWGGPVQALPCRRYSVRSTTSPGRAKNPLHGQAFEKFSLLIYWFQKYGITYPTLEMIKICPKRRLFNDINDVFWMGLGFKIWRCDRSSLEPVPHNHIGSADTPIGPKFRSCEYRLARWLLHALRGGRYIETCRARRLLHVLQR